MSLNIPQGPLIPGDVNISSLLGYGPSEIQGALTVSPMEIYPTTVVTPGKIYTDQLFSTTIVASNLNVSTAIFQNLDSNYISTTTLVADTISFTTLFGSNISVNTLVSNIIFTTSLTSNNISTTTLSTNCLSVSNQLTFFGVGPVTQYTGLIGVNTAGFFQDTGDAAYSSSGWTGNIGTTSYGVGDIVASLKRLGFIHQ